MDIKDLLNAGQSILGAVSDAVDTGDYSNLAGDVQDIVFGTSQDPQQNRYGSTQAGAAPRQNRNSGAQGGTAPRQRRSFFLVNHPDRKKARTKHLLGLIGGIGFSGATALSVLFFAAAGMVGLRPSPMGLTILFFFLLMAIVCFIVSRKGKTEEQQIDRFYQYADCIGAREYFSIEEVSSASGQTPGLVLKDMLAFRDKEMVPYLAMDKNQTTVMLTDHMYQEYEKAESARAAREEEERLERARLETQAKEEQKAARRRKKDRKPKTADAEDTAAAAESAQESAAKAPGADSGASDPEKESELDALLREGNEAIRTIREINDRIPDHYEMSNKLYRLENIMKRIFDRIRKDPARAKDIRRLMNYYLPTTIKLLRAYEELFEQDSSAAGSGNVQETKRQIEDAMDTINDAFETLLDGLFQDQAWDIASDIDVMKTMMAQDGLVDG